MTQKDYRKFTGKQYAGTKAITNKEIKNNGGQIIQHGSVVIISGKCGSGGFNISLFEDKNVSIRGVDYEDIDLLS